MCRHTTFNPCMILPFQLVCASVLFGVTLVCTKEFLRRLSCLSASCSLYATNTDLAKFLAEYLSDYCIFYKKKKKLLHAENVDFAFCFHTLCRWENSGHVRANYLITVINDQLFQTFHIFIEIYLDKCTCGLNLNVLEYILRKVWSKIWSKVSVQCISCGHAKCMMCQASLWLKEPCLWLIAVCSIWSKTFIAMCIRTQAAELCTANLYSLICIYCKFHSCVFLS